MSDTPQDPIVLPPEDIPPPPQIDHEADTPGDPALEAVAPAERPDVAAPAVADPATPPPSSDERRVVPFWRSSWPMWLGLIPVVLLLCFASAAPLNRAWESMRYPFQLDREEGYIVEQARSISQGRTIYPSLDDYPYVVGNYPPLYPMLLSLAIAGPRTLPLGLPVGRAIVLLSAVLIVCVIMNLIMRETGSVLCALLSAGLFLATWDTNSWIAYARVDIPAIALGVGGLAAITSPKRYSGLLLATLLFTLAFFTKQTQIIAPMAAVAGMLLRRQWERALAFMAIMGVAVASIFLLLNIRTGGQFIRHTVWYNANAFDAGLLEFLARHLLFWGRFKLMALLLLATALPWIWKRLGRGARSEQRRLERAGKLTPETLAAIRPINTILPTAFVFLLFSAASLTSAGKAGAAENYALEFHAAAALFAGLALGMLFQAADTTLGFSWYARSATAAAVLLLLLHGADNALLKRQWMKPAPDRMQSELVSRVSIAVDDTEGPVLCEEPIFAILSDREVLFQPFIMSQLAREGKWDETRFVQDLINAKFHIIVTTQDMFNEEQAFETFTPAMRAAIRRSYKPLSRVAYRDQTYFLYVPLADERSIDTQLIVYPGIAGTTAHAGYV